MTANSFYELYLTIFGWLLYDGIWATLLGSGLAFLPFVGVVIRTITESLENQEERAAWLSSLKRIEIAIFSMLTVVILAAQPLIPVNLGDMSYTPACTGSSTAGSLAPGSTGTTLDAVFTGTTLGGSRAEIPVWWMGVLKISGGVTAAAQTAIPCGHELRMAKSQLDNTEIKDPQTKRLLMQFYEDCWAVAADRFMTGGFSLPSGVPDDDIYWAGSKTFLNNGFYDSPLQASIQVPGFPYNEARDGHRHTASLPDPQWGYPVCKDWWTDSSAGLRTLLLNEIESQNVGLLDTILSAFGASSSQTQDAAIRNIVDKQVGVKLNNLPESDLLNNLAASLGAKMEQFTLLPKIYAIKQAAPLAQALLLMVIYMSLPFILVFSSYSISAVISTSIVVFAVKFITVFWAVADWLDAHLFDALIIGASRGDALSRALLYVENNFIDSLEKDMVDLTIGAFYLIVPMLWLFALGLGGVHAGRQISNLFDGLTGAAGSAGSAGGAATTNVAKSAITRRFR